MNTVEEVKKLALPAGSYIVVGGGCLAVRGLRETKDVDIVVTPTVFEMLISQGWSLDSVYEQKWHRRRLKCGDIEIYPDIFLEKTNTFVDIDDLIQRADVIDGIPLLPLKSLCMFKSDTGREKDIQDIALIDAFLRRN
ncbi:MAG: zinc ABC transporter substrate-binding protein [Patescibacteria group bacterium]